VSLSVVLAGGGTAGHVEPALALADALRRRFPDTRITALGTAAGLEARLVPARGYELATIPRVPLPRRPTPEVLSVPVRLAGAVRASRAVLDRVDADVVVGFGGYVALPAYLAARRRRTPIVIHEANARAGLANRVGARLTPHVAAATEGTRLRNARVLGIPLRRGIAELDRSARRPEARSLFGLHADGPVLLVTGGSQGARSLNTAVSLAAEALAAAGVQVLHATGAKNLDAVLSALPPPTEGVPYVALPYLERMDLALAAADLAVCRAGAMTVAEMSAVGLPAVYVPLPFGNGEQRLNAAPVVAAGGGLEVPDSALSREWVVETLVPLLTDPARLTAMSAAAAAHGERDADLALLDLVLEAVGGAP
jgi:UDP-N-acetylglucosamine--N-acetylmuramyl-(pentapeptide) pyrophosphoryl-undecaprenol N-acetylglucosamine transferase